MIKKYKIKKFRRINQGFTRQNFLKKISGGYTIVETMIAVSLFIVVITIGMGSLLNAHLVRGKSQSMRSIMDNLSFVMEDMSKNLRIGHDYHCIDDGIRTATVPHSCPSGGGGISFKSFLGGQWVQWVYYISNDGKIFKSVDGAESFVQLTPDEVFIDSISSFSILGAEPPELPPGDNQEPFVTIKLVGTITYENVVSPFSLQTSISQRMIDI